MPPIRDRDPSDPALMRRAAEGDEHALGVLYDRHASLVYSLVVSIVGRDEDAEEITEDVFMQIWTSAERFDPARGSLQGWVATMARSRALDHVRARKRRHAAHDRAAAADESGMAVAPSASPRADRAAERSDVRSRLAEALGLLNDDQRKAIELAYFDGLTQSEIARRLGTSLGTVKTRIRDGMIKLRERFAGSEEVLR